MSKTPSQTINSNLGIKHLCCIFMLLGIVNIYGQTYHIDTLGQWLKVGKHKQLSYQNLLLIQKENGHQNSKIVLAYAEELLTRKEVKTSEVNRANTYAEVGFNYSTAGEVTKASALLNEAINIYRKKGDKANLSIAYNKLAVHNANIDADSLAIDIYTKSMQLAQEIKDTSLMLMPLRGLSGLFLKMSLFDKCIAYAASVLKLAK
jgi:tetratricopeptide (TPR) repeat protein